MAGTALWAIAGFRADVARVERSERVLVALSDLEASVTQAESGVRAYFATGDLSYAPDLDGVRQKALHDAQDLQAFAADNPLQAARFAELADTVEARLDFFKNVLVLRQAGEPIDEINRAHGPEGRRLITAIQDLAGAARLEEQRLWAQGRNSQTRAEILSLVLCGGAIVLSVAFAIRGARTIRREQLLRDGVETQLQALNTGLEKAVAERTEELESANRELRKAQGELLASAEALRKSNTDLEAFAYAASHEFQEPLRSILIYVELLRKQYGGKLDASGETFFHFIEDGARNLSLVTQKLLEYSHAGNQTFAAATVHMESVLEQVLRELRPAIEESKAIITHDSLPAVAGDHASLCLLLRNLLTNDLKFCKEAERPMIHVSACRQGEEWVISVADQGIGFEPEYAQRIFEMFRRLHSRTEFSGHGIGLALVKRIAEAHGGRVWATSQPGAGSVFYFSLPAAAGTLQTAAAAPS